MKQPGDAAFEINRRFQADDENMLYFTMIYGVINGRTGKTKLIQAGHPSPIYLPNKTNASLIGSGGLPMGIMPEVHYEELEIDLQQKDKLIIYSDGITECTNQQMEQFSENRLFLYPLFLPP